MNPRLFFSLFQFLFFSSRVPCLVVSLSACSCAKAKKFIHHLCLRGLALNKTHDREIALWNARCDINLYANVECIVNHNLWSNWDLSCQFLRWHLIWSLIWKWLRTTLSSEPRRIVWDAATCRGTFNYQHDEPTSFFFIALQSSLLPYETRAACILLLSIAGDLLITEQWVHLSSEHYSSFQR